MTNNIQTTNFDPIENMRVVADRLVNGWSWRVYHPHYPGVDVCDFLPDNCGRSLVAELEAAIPLVVKQIEELKDAISPRSGNA